MYWNISAFQIRRFLVPNALVCSVGLCDSTLSRDSPDDLRVKLYKRLVINIWWVKLIHCSGLELAYWGSQILIKKILPWYHRWCFSGYNILLKQFPAKFNFLHHVINYLGSVYTFIERLGIQGLGINIHALILYYFPSSFLQVLEILAESFHQTKTV